MLNDCVKSWREDSRGEKWILVMQLKRKAPSLVDLCIRKAIDNLRYLEDVSKTDFDLLEQILPHCTVDQLMRIEKSTQGRDLSPITDKLWKKFYEKQFGLENTNLVLKRMKLKNVSFKWINLYEAKLKDIAEVQNKSLDRIRQIYKKEEARKQSRQVQFCSKVPPSSNKRSYWGNGTGSNVSNLRGNLMKKAKIEVLKSQEVKNITALKKNVVQRNPSPSPVKRPNGFAAKDFASTSKQVKPSERRF